MCKNATKTVASLMAAIEPTIKSLLAATGQLNTSNGIAAMNAYDAALAAVETWQSGTPAQNVLELINAFTDVFNTLPLPENVKLYVNIIEAGITAVIAILTANSPAPASVDLEGQSQAMHQAHVAAEAAAKVHALVPGTKYSVWKSVLPGNSPADQYKKAWDAAVDTNPVPGIVKV